ncbi:hypothetical protein BD289DRAFT_286348 [Coniella lustricola]|uniref:Uncharacterized protein n=1 Tax=Coniella lustricola TaxID=2025994 RepID=A0A2T3A5M8_9PEZI|nr:hypothetical protein BD289DRAFT_286348 [Coniella lustricola]
MDKRTKTTQKHHTHRPERREAQAFEGTLYDFCYLYVLYRITFVVSWKFKNESKVRKSKTNQAVDGQRQKQQGTYDHTTIHACMQLVMTMMILTIVVIPSWAFSKAHGPTHPPQHFDPVICAWVYRITSLEQNPFNNQQHYQAGVWIAEQKREKSHIIDLIG